MSVRARETEASGGGVTHRILRPLLARVSTTFFVFLPLALANRREASVGSSAGGHHVVSQRLTLAYPCCDDSPRSNIRLSTTSLNSCP